MLTCIDSLFWYAYLGLLVVISLLSVRYGNRDWLQLASLFYFFCAFYLVLILAGAQYNKQALYAARLPIAIFAIMLAWMLIQCIAPISSHYFFTTIFNVAAKPDWFSPEYYLSVDPWRSQWILFSNLFVFCGFCLTLAMTTSRKRVKQLLVAIILIGLLHAFIGLYAKFDNLILVDKKAVDGHFDAARGLFVNRNHYASFISLTLFGALSYFLKGLMQEEHDRKPTLIALDLLLSPNVVYITATVVGLIALILSESRAGLFGLTGAFIVIVTFAALYDERVSRKGMIFVVIFLLLVCLYLIFGQNIMTRLSEQGFSLGERLIQWQITWQAILDAPLLGYGAGSYATVFQAYREHIELRQVIFDQAHNEYLQLWLEQGLFGLFLFVMLMAVVINHMLKTFIKSPSRLMKALMISGLIVIIASLLQSAVDFNLQIINIRCFFFVIIALMYVAVSFSSKRLSKSVVKKHKTKRH